MYPVLLLIHSWLRWLVLLALVARLGRALAARVQGSPYVDLDRRLSLVLMILVDIQLTLGLLLWAVSPTIRQAFADPGAAMKNSAVRLLFVEHPITMIAAVVLVHVAHVIGKRATAERPPHGRVLLFTLLALVLMLSRIPW